MGKRRKYTAKHRGGGAEAPRAGVGACDGRGDDEPVSGRVGVRRLKRAVTSGPDAPNRFGDLHRA